MDLTELLRVLWQRKVISLATLLVVLGLGVLSLVVQTPVYQSTSTIAVVPAPGAEDPVFILSQVDVITPLFAEAVKTKDTERLAQGLLDEEDLGDISVRTFRGAPIIKIDSQHVDPERARDASQAVSDALIARSTSGAVGYPGLLALSQIDRPQVATEPVRPQPRLTMLVAALLGLGAAVGAAVAWDRVGRKVETADELAAAAGVPCFGEVPTDRNADDLDSASALVGEPRYRVLAEALRDIRTNLQFTDGDFRSILLTSPEGRHGKTFLSFGVAATLARSGARTLLVDGDLRRGRIADMLHVAGRPGLMEVMGGAPLATAVRPLDLAALSLLPGGKLSDDPGEMLESTFFQALHSLEAAYDVVVIDGTPLVPVNDARLMARYTSTVLLVVAAGTVTRRQVRVSVERLSIIGVDLTAVILNQSKARRRPGYYRYLRTKNEVSGERC